MTYAHASDLLRRGTDRRFAMAHCTVLAFIRRAEYLGRVPWRERLDAQPCELGR